MDNKDGCEVLWAFLGMVASILMVVFMIADTKKQEEVCRVACKPLEVQEIWIDNGTFYYGLEDGSYRFSHNKDIRIGDEVCECSGKVIKLNE